MISTYIKILQLSFFNISYIFAIDSLSISLIILSSFTLLMCFLIYWFLKYKISFYSLYYFFLYDL